MYFVRVTFVCVLSLGFVMWNVEFAPVHIVRPSMLQILGRTFERRGRVDARS